MEICEKNMCTGCGMCADLCSHKAISMQPDTHGFLHPAIDQNKCVKCHICTTKCPLNNPIDNYGQVVGVYAAWNKNIKIRKNSSSGGIFSLLADAILNENGIVAGVGWDEYFHTYHCCIDTKDDMHLLNGSKYVQSISGNIYSTVKRCLSDGKKVLFSGTPCQVHALQLYLGRTYDNLYTVDLVCHGVPSADMFVKHLNEISGGQARNVKDVQLRYKKPCWSYGSVKIEISGKPLYMKPTVKDAYFNLFNFNYSLRESCHVCQYTNLNRQSDITLCDFWGFTPNSLKMRDFDKGVSCILINTEKGSHLFDIIKANMIFEKSSVELAKKANQCLSKPFTAPVDNNEFWNDYDSGMSVMDLYAKYIKSPYIIPKMLWLRRIKRQYQWLLGKSKS